MKSRSDVGLSGQLRVVDRPADARDDVVEGAFPRTTRTTRSARPRMPAPPSGVLRRYQTLGLGLAASDVLALVVALVLSRLTLFSLEPLPASYYIVLVAAPLLWVAVFHAFGLYVTHHLSASEEFRRTIGAASVGIMLVVIGSYWWDRALPREWVALTWLLALVLELIARRVWRWYAYKLKADGRLALRTLIIGTNDEAGRLAESLQSKGLGFRPIGYVTSGERFVSPDDLPVLGRLDELDELIAAHATDCVFVASTAIDSEGMLHVVQTTRQAEVEARVSANLPQLLTSRLSVQPVGHVMALSLKPVRLTGTQTVIKRAFDLTVASVGLVCIAPLWAVVASLIRLTSKGPVLFRQERVTKGGHTFTVYKFRTMVTNASEVLERRGIDPSAPYFKLEDDPRLTPVGRLLRKLSLDELPQLLNVLRGEMSLVGPRPLPAEQVAANLELLSSRHEVPAGVTGWWQINGRSEVDFEEAIRMDLFYIENWSLSLDLYILLKTVGCVLAQRGAH